MGKGIPVSYTHLDVYKRQLLIGLWMETDYEEKAGLTAGKEKKAGCKKLNLQEEYDLSLIHI